MLAYLRVRNLAVLKDVEVDLGPGLNVLTGETGAGKSILVQSVGLLLGDRADASQIRDDADAAIIEGQFTVAGRAIAAQLEAAGVDADGESVVVRREIRRAGTNRTFVNGSLVPLAFLRQFAGTQVALHGQNRHLTLATRDAQRAFVDAAVPDADALATLTTAWETLSLARRERVAFEEKAGQRAERLEMLRLRLHALDAAELESGEDVRLRAEERRLATSAERNERVAAIGEILLDGDGAVGSGLSRARIELERLAELDSRLADEPRRLAEAALVIEDVAQSVARTGGDDEGDPSRLAQIQERLAEIQRLRRKHGVDLEGLLVLRDDLRREAAELDDTEVTIERLTAAEQRAAGAYHRAAVIVGRLRRDTARRLGEQASAALDGLGLQGARFEIATEAAMVDGTSPDDIHRQGGPRGYETVEFRFAARGTGDPRPMARVASGGELSRLMLGLQLVSQQDAPAGGPATFIFDEVDAGVGGDQAGLLARRLREVARGHQVLCVTHLAQIAAAGDRHLRIEKQIAGRGIETGVKTLSEADRLDELARMLGDGGATETARRHAEALVAAARERPAGGARRPGRAAGRRGRATL